MDNDEIEKPAGSLQAFQDFADKLTFQRILNALLAGILALSLYTLYENRTKVFNDLVSAVTSERVNWDISASSKSELHNLVVNNQLIKLVLISAVDLQKNKREEKYWFIDDPEGLVISKNKTLLPQAVFDSDPKNTQQMVAVLNNEFVCSKYSDTIFNVNFPELSRTTPYICRLAIPPFYGRFIGILSFGLTAEPTPAQIFSLKIEASRLAIQIYLHDVVKHG